MGMRFKAKALGRIFSVEALFEALRCKNALHDVHSVALAFVEAVCIQPCGDARISVSKNAAYCGERYTSFEHDSGCRMAKVVEPNIGQA